MKIWELKVNKFIDELKDLFPRRWNTRNSRAFIECIQNDVSRALLLVSEHFFETFYHSVITRLPHSTVVCRIELGEYITTGIGPRGKLDEKASIAYFYFDFRDVDKQKLHDLLPPFSALCESIIS